MEATVTFSMKNYIGIQDDRHRLIDHDHRLNEKVADLQYVIQPQFIAIDGITAGEGRMLTPKPFQLNLIVIRATTRSPSTRCAAPSSGSTRAKWITSGSPRSAASARSTSRRSRSPAT